MTVRMAIGAGNGHRLIHQIIVISPIASCKAAHCAGGKERDEEGRIDDRRNGVGDPRQKVESTDVDKDGRMKVYTQSRKRGR